MRIQKNKFLLLCALVMLSLDIVGGAECQGCHEIKPDNTCTGKSFVCTIGAKGHCFIRRFQTKGEITKISRGCIGHCKTGVYSRNEVDIFTWCCTSDNCNSMNAWY